MINYFVLFKNFMNSLISKKVKIEYAVRKFNAKKSPVSLCFVATKATIEKEVNSFIVDTDMYTSVNLSAFFPSNEIVACPIILVEKKYRMIRSWFLYKK